MYVVNSCKRKLIMSCKINSEYLFIAFGTTLARGTTMNQSLFAFVVNEISRTLV